jgi:site-specific recombinase XerD
MHLCSLLKVEQKENVNMAKTSYSSPLLSQIAQAIRVRHDSIRTEKSYIDWIKRFIYFHHKRHPKEMGGAEVAAFLTHLAVDRNVAAATQNQALNALVFLYKVVLQRPLQDHIQRIVRAKKPKRLPVVLTKEEVAKLLSNLDGVYWLLGCLQYSSGLRLIESMRLRVRL